MEAGEGAMPPPVGSEDVRNATVFQDSVPASQVPPDRRTGGAAARVGAGGSGGGGGAGGKSAVRRPTRVREPMPVLGGSRAGVAGEWDAAKELSFSRVEPVVNPKAKRTSALAAALGPAQPQQLPHLPRSAVTREGSNRDNLNLQVSVDVSDVSGAFKRRQLIVFSKCTVDQVIGMTLRECKNLDAETDWGSERDYELYMVDASRPAAGIDPDTNPLQGRQKIGDFPGQLNFALVRVPGAYSETPSSPALQPQGDAAGSVTPSIATEQESMRIPPPIVAQQLKSLAEEVSENVGTQNVCKHCGERIDFIRVSPDKIGSLKKQMDHTGLWRDRWFQLYGNHLVYWNAAKEDLDLASGRGVIHLDADVKIAPSQPSAVPPPVDGAASVAGSSPDSSAGGSSYDRGTIMAGSMTRSAMAGEETHAGRKLLTQSSDPLDESIEGGSPKLAGGTAEPGDSGAMPLESATLASVQMTEDAQRVRASGAFPDLRLTGTTGDTDKEFSVVLPHKTYNFRAETSQECDSWIAALKNSAGTLFHTCLFCWKNVDPSSSVDQAVVCRGHLCIQLNPKLPKQFDKRWMVCTTNSRAGSTHIVYYKERSHEGKLPAQGCIHLYEGENRVSVYASEFEKREDASGGEYTVYKLNVRRGDDRHVLHKRWSRCDKLHKDMAREHKLPATVYLPKKWQQTNDAGRLEKRRCQLNHYFAELSGWANREGLDLWDSSVSAAFTAFVREPDDGTEHSRSSLGPSGTPSPPVEGVGTAQPDGSGDSNAAVSASWEDSYLTLHCQRTRKTLVPQPPARLGSFAFGVSQSKVSDNSADGGAVSPTVQEDAAGSPREASGHNPAGASAALEALRESESELGDRSPIGRDSGSGKHYLHLQSPLKTYYLYAETEDDLNRWLDALSLPWLGTMDSSPRSASADGGAAIAAAGSAQQGRGSGVESQLALLEGGASGSTRGRSSSYARPGRLDTRVSLSSRNLEQ